MKLVYFIILPIILLFGCMDNKKEASPPPINNPQAFSAPTEQKWDIKKKQSFDFYLDKNQRNIYVGRGINIDMYLYIPDFDDERSNKYLQLIEKIEKDVLAEIELHHYLNDNTLVPVDLYGYFPQSNPALDQGNHTNHHPVTFRVYERASFFRPNYFGEKYVAFPYYVRQMDIASFSIENKEDMEGFYRLTLKVNEDFLKDYPEARVSISINNDDHTK